MIAGTPERLTTGDVEIVVPVYNEARSLPGCISALHGYLSAHFPVPWRITVVNNASTDSTADVAASLARSLHRCRGAQPRPQGAWSGAEGGLAA